MWGLYMRAHLIAAFSVIGSGVFVGGGVDRGIHDDAVEEGVQFVSTACIFAIESHFIESHFTPPSPRAK